MKPGRLVLKDPSTRNSSDLASVIPLEAYHKKDRWILANSTEPYQNAAKVLLIRTFHFKILMVIIFSIPILTILGHFKLF